MIVGPLTAIDIGVSLGVVVDHKDLRVYGNSFDAAMTIYRMTRHWPVEERYSMTDQILRSSRSVCANISEAWRRRHYPKYFKSKLIDADSEATETITWLEFAASCGYITEETFADLSTKYHDINRMLWHMIQHSDNWTPRSTKP